MKFMKLKLLIASLFIALNAFAQIPNGYYNNATGTGYALKTQLYNIIKGHSDKGYDGLYDTYETSDTDNFFEKDGSVLDMYTEIPSGKDKWNYFHGQKQCGNYKIEGDCYNREHIIPQSVFDKDAPMVSDAHSVTPTDGKVNGIRSNYPHGNVANVSTTTSNGSKLGSSKVSGYSGTVFEPIDEFKGDIARMYFYFVTRYENNMSGYNFGMFNNTAGQSFTTPFLKMLNEWHKNDPVSERERVRNNAIYARQKNRNPFIDKPEFVQAIWGAVLSVDENENLLENVSIYPNPSTDGRVFIKSNKAIDEIEFFNTNGQIINRIQPKQSQEFYILENLFKGYYILKLKSNTQSTTKKIIIN